MKDDGWMKMIVGGAIGNVLAAILVYHAGYMGAPPSPPQRALTETVSSMARQETVVLPPGPIAAPGLVLPP